MTNDARLKGTITRILPNRGFCFIKDEDGVSRFAHTTAFVPPIAFDKAREGMAVEFTPSDSGPTGNRMRALEVTVLGGAK